MLLTRSLHPQVTPPSRLRRRCSTRGPGLIGVALAALALTPGCVTPANPVAGGLGPSATSPAGLGPSAETQPSSGLRPLNGEYEGVFQSWFVGPVVTRFTAEALGEGARFKANTRPGVAWKRFTGFEQAVGSLLAAFIFPRGMILHWTSDSPAEGAGAKPAEGWIGITTVGPLRARTLMRGPEGPVEIRTQEGKPFGVFTLRKLEGPKARPDYPALIDSMDAAARARLYDPAVAQGQAMKSFLDEARVAAGEAEDDLEFLFGLVMAWRKQRELPLPLIYRPPDPGAMSGLLSEEGRNERPLEVTFDEKTRVAKITVNVLLERAQIDSSLREAAGHNPVGIVLDMQNCPGLELAGLRLAAWFATRPIDCGWFFGPAWRDRADDAAVPTITLDDEASYAQVDEFLVRHGAAKIVVNPVAKPFLGRVVVLTSKRTISTAEVSAWALRAALQSADPPRLTIIGERTGKKPMLTREAPIAEGWVARLAEFDWRPPGQAASAPWEGLAVDEEADRETSLRRGPRRAAAPLQRQSD